MTKLGADVEALDTLSRKFDEESGKIQQAITMIASQLSAAWWEGPDAQRFREDWESNHRQALQRLGEALTQAANHCRTQANQQREVSRG